MANFLERLLHQRFPDGIPWRSRRFWHPLGYALTAIWMIGILIIVQNDVRHPLFDYFFSVPLAGWILGLVAARIVNRVWPERPGGADERNDRL